MGTPLESHRPTESFRSGAGTVDSAENSFASWPCLHKMVFSLCYSGLAAEAVQVLESSRTRTGVPRRWAFNTLEHRYFYYRLLSFALIRAGRYRCGAAAGWRALRLAGRELNLPAAARPWHDLAFAYRQLWAQTGQDHYYRRYLLFTGETTDDAQIRQATADLARLQRAS
ncbi:MAG: hypothetical protein WD535_02695 [Thermaerobacterales bacterium]